MSQDLCRGFMILRVGALCLGVAMASVHAEDQDSRVKEALQRTQQALQQAQSDNDQLQSTQAALTAQKASLESDKAKLSDQVKSLSAAKAQARAAQGKVSELQTQVATLQDQLKQAQSQNADLGTKLGETQKRLHVVTGLLESATKKTALLESRNEMLYQVGLSAIDMYRSRSPADTWMQKVSVLGFSEVKVENSAEALRTRLDSARYANLPAGLASAASAPATASSQAH